jgi:uncharacterized membrane protein
MPNRFSLMHMIRRRPRLASALAAGVALALVVPADGVVRRFLFGWTAMVWTYLMLIGFLMLRASRARARSISEQEDPSAAVVLALLSCTAMASLAAIVVELGNVRALGSALRFGHYLLAASTVLGSWLMLNTIFAFHYAHVFYRSPPDARPLRFPEGGTTDPDYWDFLYFSFTIGVAAQTSDVSVLTTPMRKAVLAQSVLVFMFNLAIIGLSINVAAGVLSG